jgi:hypothetical protein
MSNEGTLSVDTSVGRLAVDQSGSPVGVVRLDVAKSYAGVGELLQRFINDQDQEAWGRIRAKIDYTYESLDSALGVLEAQTRFSREIRERVQKGQKLLFKPNLVNLQCIHPQTHGPDLGSTACTEWPFTAALMRWFHDRLGVSYYHMALGEAATLMPSAASLYSTLKGNPVTTEALIEGRSGGFYAGWGFYFARRYLSDSLGPDRREDPMRGYEESVSGIFIPPGRVADKLMVYDLNRICDDETKGRDVDVPDGVNFPSITLHKVIVGGDPRDPSDREAYPGCILVNIPKMKVHAITLFTNVIKNLGIGLYPMQCAKAGERAWDYAGPQIAIPGAKTGIPHIVWVPELDQKSGLPRKDAAGNARVAKTGGITATMLDIIQAVKAQSIFMIHVVDAIEGINLDHQGLGVGLKSPEGMVFARLDPVATDLLCARYMFSNVSLKDALATDMDDGAGGRFPQAVPIPTAEGKDIVTHMGYDCPLSRDVCLQNAEKRGLGQRRYCAAGHDRTTDSPIVSVQGHLGAIRNGVFSDVITKTLYFDLFKVPWDLQRTSLSYLAAVDRLTGSTLSRNFLSAFDENGDGVVSYEEFGKTGIWGSLLHWLGVHVSGMGTDALAYVKARFSTFSWILKHSDPSANPWASDLLREFSYGYACLAAMRMAELGMESPDPFCPGLTWGKGKWPSFQLAWYLFSGTTLYGQEFPFKIGMPSLYSGALCYADLTQNEGRYVGAIRNQPQPGVVTRYLSMVSSGEAKPLDFKMFVPVGYENVAGSRVPNVEATTDPALIWTASFAGGKEVWPEAKL